MLCGPGRVVQPPVYRARVSIGSMWQPWTPSRPRADLLALQISAEHAGSALACSFSSSDEFEAAIVRSKIDAGVYGPRRRRRFAIYAGAAASVLAVVVWMI